MAAGRVDGVDRFGVIDSDVSGGRRCLRQELTSVSASGCGDGGPRSDGRLFATPQSSSSSILGRFSPPSCPPVVVVGEADRLSGAGLRPGPSSAGQKVTRGNCTELTLPARDRNTGGYTDGRGIGGVIEAN